ncbi:DNA-binding protein [Pseudoflavonifractor sp. 524-17]|uniref:YlxM family DNA-binding protein n=1 Tax=Pseudoflavonifractor sp. 524-17 TaxID=2304577 RepID=UPI00137A0953|nr:sigma factor-like helix-turn-helix DNA-binding protein [Pseudoflavonifractor sp. 524-17]NCE64307.1 DNA-binding protein [Pseudoflavonifractor sp. 524-17]
MKSQAYRMAMLFDFYGDMLTDRQREFYDLYYNEDLSLAEIAENYGITRQGVRDVIVRAEGILTELEDKTGIIKRFYRMQDQFAAIQSAVDAIRRINEDRRYYDNGIEAGCNDIQHALDRLKQE